MLTLNGAVSPATADYLLRGMRTAADRKASLVVIKMDTPGGLDTAMRDIIKAILTSPVPVATFVSPSGARAASAGTYILYASHVAAMAPGTNLGAATPVAIGLPGQPPAPKAGDEDKASDAKKADADGSDKDKKAAPADAMSAKQVNDAAAYIRGLAQLRGRNSEWAELAVREAASLSAEDAVGSQVVDLIALDIPDLLKRIDGRTVSVEGLERTLKTSPVELQVLDPDWRSRLLAVIANPGVALILMMIGIYGLIFEFSNPGFVVPGVVGAICLLLAAFAFQLMPINYAGLALILLGIGFLVGEAFMPSFGILGIGGATAMIIGSVMLFDEEASAAYALPTSFVVALGAVSSALVFATVALALKARKRPVVSGREDLLAATGIALEDFTGEGWVRVAGERWRARCTSRLHSGQVLRVTALDGLKLSVEPAGEANGEPGGDKK
ncbi:MAG TPA: nodulation protein NfeD [Rhodocyclaceae bacterium]